MTVTLAHRQEALIAHVPANAAFARMQMTANADFDFKLRTADSESAPCLAGYACQLATGSERCPDDFDMAGYYSANRCNTRIFNGMTGAYVPCPACTCTLPAFAPHLGP